MNPLRAGLFPGQGSQQVGMGKSFHDEFPLFRNCMEEASDALGINLKKLCFDGPDSDLLLTENAQPAILAVSTGCFRVAKETMGAQINVSLGHSLGEYSALVASGAIPFSESIRWVRERGLAMQKAVPVGEGTMSAILGAEDAQVDGWCKEATTIAKRLRIENKDNENVVQYTVDCTVEPANYNSPGQVVVSGSVDAIDVLEKLIKEKNIPRVMAKRLNVSAPFHCSLMKPARERMESIFKDVSKAGKIKGLSIPYIPNRTARLTTEPTVIFGLLEEQIDHSVLWKQSIETLLTLGYTRAYEFGPGKVLQGLGKRIAKAVEKEFEVTPIFDVESLKAAESAGKK